MIKIWAIFIGLLLSSVPASLTAYVACRIVGLPPQAFWAILFLSLILGFLLPTMYFVIFCLKPAVVVRIFHVILYALLLGVIGVAVIVIPAVVVPPKIPPPYV